MSMRELILVSKVLRNENGVALRSQSVDVDIPNVLQRALINK